MIYPKNFEQKIGFTTIRHEIEKRCISPLGLTYCEQMEFNTHFPAVKLWLNQTNEFLGIINSNKEFPLNFIFDLRSVLKAVTTPGTFLSAENLFNLQRSLTTVSDIIKFFTLNDEEQSPYPNLRELVSGMQAFGNIIDDIAAVLDKNGNIKDNASPLLAELRRTIMSVTSSINGMLRRIISQGKQNGVLDSDVQPSVRDGRLVIPVAPAHKRKVKGIVHDESASGKTVFIEPEEIVEANNRIRETEAEIAREIIRILTAVTDSIRPHIDELLGTYAVLGQIDFIRAKALFAHEIGAQLPHIQEKPLIEWYHATHPGLYLSLKEQGKEVVPLNLQLDRKQRILLFGKERAVRGDAHLFPLRGGEGQKRAELRVQQRLAHHVQIEIFRLRGQAAQHQRKFLRRHGARGAARAGAERTGKVAAVGDLDVRPFQHALRPFLSFSPAGAFQPRAVALGSHPRGPKKLSLRSARRIVTSWERKHSPSRQVVISSSLRIVMHSAVTTRRSEGLILR